MLGQPPGGALGQGGCRGAGKDAEASLQWEQASVAWFEVFVEVTPEADGAEEGSDGVGGGVASAIALAVVAQAVGQGFGFEVIEGPVAKVEADVAEEFLEAEFQVACGGGGDGLCPEVLEETCDLLEVGQEASGQGEQGSGAGGCQQEGEQGRVRHGGVLSRGVWSVVTNPRFLGKTPPFKQKALAQRESSGVYGARKGRFPRKTQGTDRSHPHGPQRGRPARGAAVGERSSTRPT